MPPPAVRTAFSGSFSATSASKMGAANVGLWAILASANIASADAKMSKEAKRGRTLTLYRDDSTAQVRYERVKSYFFTANNTVLTISRYDADEGDAHHYIHWPRERFCWFKDQPA
jgi:hypothetical protein